jgi:phosphatidylglycerophosphatase A
MPGRDLALARVTVAPWLKRPSRLVSSQPGSAVVSRPVPHAAAIVGLSILGTWASNHVAAAEGIEDPQKVVIDEVCGTLIAMGMVSGCGLGIRLLALGLFRVLDITKPGPIDSVQHLEPPGVGIMADDVLAGLAAGVMAYSASALLGR